MTDGNKDIMSANRLAAVNEEASRLNARAVVQRMELMQEQLDDFKDKLEQTNVRIAGLQAQMNLQQQLANQIATFGSGPTG